MKKFLKVFSVVALLCCCMFGFVGCDIFEDDKTKNDYANLIAERKIIREVINNTQTMLESNLETETEPLAKSSQIYAKSNEDVADNIVGDAMRGLQLTMKIVEGVMSEADFVPGKLYRFTLSGDYFVVNIYSDGDDVITLNLYTNSQYNDIDETSYESMDIYYNEKREVTKIIDYSKNVEIIEIEEEVNEYCAITNMLFSNGGELISYSALSSGSDGEKNAQTIVDGIYNEYEESDFTDEMNTEFESSMEVLNARTSLPAYARPLSQDAQNKLDELMENIFS